MAYIFYIIAMFVLMGASLDATRPVQAASASKAGPQIATSDNRAGAEGGEAIGGEAVDGETVAGETTSWSFRSHPHPRKFEYSDAQNQLWEDALMGNGHAIDICDDLLEAEYEVYKLHYPDFVAQELSLEPKLQRAWRDHLVIEQYHLPSMCMINSAHARILELLKHLEWVSFRFCGAVAVPPPTTATAAGGPQTFDEEYLAAGLNQMLAFSALGAPEAIVNALFYAAVHPNLALNADVEYFLRMSLRRTRRFERHWQVVHLHSHLSDERRAFVDQAVIGGDLKSVRQTSAPCSEVVPRPQPAAIRAAQ